jgi:Domain of Unknown Function (DUF1080)
MRPLDCLVLLLTLVAARPAEVTWDASGLPVAKPADREDVKPVPPPSGAVVLFDGKSLEGWTAKDGKEKPAWKIVEGGVLEAGGGDILSKRPLAGDLKLHVEFRVPYMPKEKGQARGNSGVYVQGRYEVQVLDSYGIEKPGQGDCGAIYGVEPPLVNAAKAPTVWQSYDIEFHSPRFESGKKAEPARMTVYWNGVRVHDRTAIKTDNTTAGLGGDPAKPGPLMLQDHGAPVQYRNIWLVALPTSSKEEKPGR